MSEPTTEQEAPTRRGWAWLVNSPKWHYFVGAQSACNRWLGLGLTEFDDDPATDNSPDNCTTCKKKVAKLRAEEAKK